MDTERLILLIAGWFFLITLIVLVLINALLEFRKRRPRKRPDQIYILVNPAIRLYERRHCLIIDGRIYITIFASKLYQLPDDREWLPAAGFSRSDYL